MFTRQDALRTNQFYLLADKQNIDNMATIDDIKSLLCTQNSKSLGYLNPTLFNGRPDENAYSFLKQFEHYTEYNEIKDDKKANLFKMLLRNLAANWFETLDVADKKDYTKIKVAFAKHFQSTANNFLTRPKLELICYKEGEPIETYIENILTLANNLDLNDLDRKLALTRGLTPALKASIIAFNPPDMMATIHQLMLLETGNIIQKQTLEVKSHDTQITTLSASIANLEKVMPNFTISDNQLQRFTRAANYHNISAHITHPVLYPLYDIDEYTGNVNN